MDLIKEHISLCLHSFVIEKSTTLEAVNNEIQNDLRTDLIELIRYLNHLLDKTFIPTNDTVTNLHIHIDDEFNDAQKLLIAEFLSIKTFIHYHSTDNDTNEANLAIIELKAAFETKLNVLEMKCPDGASGKNGGNRIWRNWVNEKKENKSLLNFYESLNERSELKPKSIINTQKNFCSSVSQIFEFKPYCVSINSKYKSYNILNATKTLNEIDIINNKIIDDLDSILLFDCERKSLMTNFSLEKINEWNSDYDTIFKKYLIITFGKEYQSINNLRNKIDLIRERFKIPPNSSYTINKSEIDFLLKRKVKSSTSIDFIGSESSSFWETFVLETSIRELYELRSIKLMNIYSICYTDEIKSYIIEDLFSKKEVSDLISSSTKIAILELMDDDIEKLKEALSNTLDFIINSDIKTKIIESLINTPTIIFDESIIKNLTLQKKIIDSLNIERSINFKTWSDLLNSGSNNLLILSYRDQGKYPNYYYPNLLEIEYHPDTIATAILPHFLFAYHYKWSKYNLLKEYFKYLNHPIREKHFDWNQLWKLILELKPEAKLDIDWNLENVYSSSENKESFKVKLKNQRVKTFHSSDLLIFSEFDIEKPKIERFKWFFENVDFDETKYKIQKIDEFLDEFNPAEKLIDTSQHEVELQIIRKQLGLENETAGRIWKVLLNKKAEIIGQDTLYSDLLQLFSNNNIPLVKPGYFISSWLNTQSDTLMPRGNKVFKTLCDYLKLSKNYRLILYRLKNTSISGKIEATRKYSSLLKDLFADGCFNKGVSLESILQNKIQHYQKNHSLEELGIDNQNPMSGLITLIELIQPELKLLELETIEKLSNE